MKFTTASGSTYEVDKDNKQVRRLNGKNDPTPRQGQDGQWRKYADISVVVGDSAMIFWNRSDTPLLEGSPEVAIPGTITSTVISIEP